MSRYQRPSRRRANAAITALSLSALLGFGALAVDIAWVRFLDAQLEAASDAGALAGASQLDGTPEGLERAIALAVDVANRNPIAVDFEWGPEHVELGRWDPLARAFEPLGTSWPEATDMVRMSARLESIPVVLARAAFGVNSLVTHGASGAWRPLDPLPASEVECYLPIVLPTCMFPVHPEVNPPPMKVQFGTDKTDTVGWAMPVNANANSVQKQISDGCEGQPLQTGETMNISNGIVHPALQAVAKEINSPNGRAEPWDTDKLGPLPDHHDPELTMDPSSVHPPRWGQVLQGPIALVDLGGAPGSCEGASSFNGNRTIETFAWGVIYDVRTQGNAEERGLMLQLDFVNEYLHGSKGSPSGTGNVFAPPGPPVLVL